MLLHVYDPRNEYTIMEENPLHSKDLSHGVPALFRDILEELSSPVDPENVSAFDELIEHMEAMESDGEMERQQADEPPPKSRNTLMPRMQRPQK